MYQASTMSFTKFYKNLILCGEADHHCLLCDETFHNIDDIEKHIRWEKHRKVIKIQTCLPKFKNDGIFKVENFYYCQYCNHIIKNLAAVKDHIATEYHISNKTSPKEPERTKVTYDATKVVIGNIKLDTHQWHSILNKKCFLCNIGVENVLKHIESQGHVIRLIQTETLYEGDDKCYRKVNDETFQCFTCKKTFPTNSFNTHWEHSDHATAPTESHKTNGHTERPLQIFDRALFNEITDREFSIEKLADVTDDPFFQVDLINKEIICKKCNNAIKNTEKDLGNHLYKKHKIYNTQDSKMIKYILDENAKNVVYVYERDHGKARHKLAIYGRDNHIKLNCGGSKGYCTLCDRYLSAHINIFKQHVNGAVHTGHLEMKNQIKPRKHKKGPSRSENFTRYLSQMEWMPELDAVAINMSLCIDRDSFILMKEIKHGPHFKKIKCFACDEDLITGTEKKHREGNSHKTNVLAAKVISEKNNFIREIRPKLYHCGLCNITLPFWETLEKHMTDISHQMKIVEKHFVRAVSDFVKENGFFPTGVKIEHSTNNDLLYSNILSGLFGDY